MSRISDWNYTLMIKAWPSISFLTLCFCVGVIGNFTVLVIYRSKLISAKGPRFFIPVLASVDLISVSFSSLSGIIYHNAPISTASNPWCTTVVFADRWMAYISMMTLFAISYDRYRRICNITRRKFTFKQRKIALMVILSLSVLINVPIFATSGSVAVSKQVHNTTVKGMTCVFANNKFPLLEKLYSVIAVFVVLVCLVASTVCNIRVTCVIVDKVGQLPVVTRFCKRNPHKNIVTMHLPESMGRDNRCPREDIFCRTPILDQAMIHRQPGDKTMTNEDIAIHDQNSGLRCGEGKPKSRPQTFSMKTALKKSRNSAHAMFSIIFLVFVISYIPSVVATVYTRYSGYEWLFDDSDVRINVYCILMSSPLVSHALNPFIYGCFDKKFCQILKKLLRCLKT